MNIDRAKEVLDKHLAEMVAQGFEPVLVTFPEQTTDNKNCRCCGQPGEKFVICIFGREIGKMYPYCVAMVCVECNGSEERQEEFLDKVELRYRSLSK
jgi:hypothetical protein